jgi:hypothetical protein
MRDLKFTPAEVSKLKRAGYAVGITIAKGPTDDYVVKRRVNGTIYFFSDRKDAQGKSRFIALGALITSMSVLANPYDGKDGLGQELSSLREELANTEADEMTNDPRVVAWLRLQISLIQEAMAARAAA